MKKTATILVIATILVGATYFLLQPKDIISDPELLDIVRVVSYSGGEGSEITDEVDLDRLAFLISGHQRRRFSKPFAPYMLSEIRYEINGTYIDKSLHILVGDLNVVYESSDRGGFEIIDSTQLLTEIELLAKP